MDALQKRKYLHSTRKRFDPFALVCSLVLLGFLLFHLGGQHSLDNFWDLRSFLVVVGGTFASVLIQFDFYQCLRCGWQILRSFWSKPEKQMLQSLQQLDSTILNEGSLVDLRPGQSITGELLGDIVYMMKKSLSFDDIDAFVRSRLHDELADLERSVLIVKRAALLAPSLGLFGTVVGLVILLKNLSDPSQIGPAMSLALLTTAYGSGLSSLVFTPLSGRLEHHKDLYAEAYEQLLSKVGILINSP